MKTLIKPEWARMLWKDEIGDTFLILRCGEIFRISDEILGMYVFSHAQTDWLLLKKIIKHFRKTDDQFYCSAKMDKIDLPTVIKKFGYKRRPNREGLFIKRCEERFGHRVIKTEPILQNDMAMA